MPRSFTREERENIRKKLIEKGTLLFSRFGLKKTSIDEIVRETGIAKGSFYKFFPSKEVLYFRCMEKQEIEMQERYLIPIFTSSDDPGEMFNNLFSFIFNMPEEFPLITIMLKRDEYAEMIKALPKEIVEGHRQKDLSEMGEFLASWKGMGIEINENRDAVNGLFQVIALVNLHREEIGNEIFPETVNLLSRILAAGMKTLYCRGGEND